jgi:hypothetical protein
MSKGRKRIIKLKVQQAPPPALPPVLYPQAIEEEKRRQATIQLAALNSIQAAGIKIVQPGEIDPRSLVDPQRIENIKKETNPALRETAAVERKKTAAIRAMSGHRQIRAALKRWRDTIKELNLTVKQVGYLIGTIAIITKAVMLIKSLLH